MCLWRARALWNKPYHHHLPALPLRERMLFLCFGLQDYAQPYAYSFLIFQPQGLGLSLSPNPETKKSKYSKPKAKHNPGPKQSNSIPKVWSLSIYDYSPSYNNFGKASKSIQRVHLAVLHVILAYNCIFCFGTLDTPFWNLRRLEP